MAVEWCQPCRARGRLSIARHDVKCTLMCDECFSGRESKGVPIALVKREPVRKIEEGNVGRMGRVIDEATRKAIVADAAAGELSVNAIADKHSVGWITAKTIIDESGGKTVAKKKVARPADANRATAVVLAEPAVVGLGPLTAAKAEPDNRVRFILLDAQISSGGLAELTKSVVEALKK